MPSWHEVGGFGMCLHEVELVCSHMPAWHEVGGRNWYVPARHGVGGIGM